MSESRSHGIFRIDEYGYAHFAHPDLMSGIDANRLADRDHPDCDVLAYWEYLKKQDPDSMSDKALRKHLGLPDRGAEKTAAITGTLPGISRFDAERIVESRGYRIVARVTRNTTLLITGAGGGRKSDDARAMGVSVDTWEHFATYHERCA